MDPTIISPAHDELHHAIAGNQDSLHDHEVVSNLKEHSFDIRRSEALRYSPRTEYTSPGGSNSEYQDDPIVIVGMGKTNFQSHLAVVFTL